MDGRSTARGILGSLGLSLLVAACGSSHGQDAGVDSVAETVQADRGVEAPVDAASTDAHAEANTDLDATDAPRDVIGNATDMAATEAGPGDAPSPSDVGTAGDAWTADGAQDTSAEDAPAMPDGSAPDRGQISDATDSADDRPAVDAAGADGPLADAGGTDAGGIDAGPPTETSKCAAGRVRVHVRDIWSQGVTPTLGVLPDPPSGIVLTESDRYLAFAARLDSAVDVAGRGCAYYSACIPNTTRAVFMQPLFASGCMHASQSRAVDISAVNRSGELWIEYTGTSGTLATDFAQTPSVPVGPGKFQVTADSSTLVAPACRIGTPAPQAARADAIRVHFRWPFTDPIKTGYPGSACGDDALGYSPPPYPTNMRITGLNCSLHSFLELNDGKCTWYTGLIPKNMVPINADARIMFEYPDFLADLRTDLITLPTLSNPANEYWIAFTGVASPSPGNCSTFRVANSFSVLTQNPGPAYAGCGGM